MPKRSRKRKRPNAVALSSLKIEIASHSLALAIQYIINSRPETHLIPEVARTPMMRPVPPALNLWDRMAQCARRIGLEIGKHSLRRCLTRHDGVHVSRPDMYSMGHPLPMLAHGANRFKRDLSSLSLQ